MYVFALGAFCCLAMVAVMTPTVVEALRAGQPLEPIGLRRLGFFRAVAAPIALTVLGFSLYHRRARDLRPLRQILFALPLVLIAVVILYKWNFGVADSRYIWLLREDGPVEYATVVIYLIGAPIAMRAAWLARDWQVRAFLTLLALGMVFVALSEVSFGQRLLRLETPDTLKAINVQREITVHNIRGVQFLVYAVMPQALLIYAIFGRKLLRWLASTRLGRHLSRDLLLVAPAPWYAVPYFVPMVIYSIKGIAIENDVFYDQEPSELALGIGFSMIAFNAWWLLKGASAVRVAEPAAVRADVLRGQGRLHDRRPSASEGR